MTGQSVEMVAPTQIVKGDVIEDPVGHRWLTVHDVQLLTDAGGGAYGFYGKGPDDRVTFEEGEVVKRKIR
jgi:hypothetical protein